MIDALVNAAELRRRTSLRLGAILPSPSPSQSVEAFPSRAEQEAVKAQTLNFLSRFNLVGVRSSLVDLLHQIGSNGIFAEYTRHDISHIDTMLGMLEWVVPSASSAIMTATDWMLIVLAVYFHDAGLVVTKQEYDKREQSDFPQYKRTVLEAGGPSAYKERVASLPPDEAERFLYQEFVRTHHAERIRRWITGEPYHCLGVACEAQTVVASLVAPLDASFREDLALVCESHHKDDLNDLAKYVPQRAYGNALQETANLQFSAILLRTVDLLHVTRDRTPSVAFALTTPSDPKSIEEWSKQMPVVAVRKSPPRDDSGKVDAAAIANTISVTATFHNPLGFFSLTEYLYYVEQQLKQSHQWTEATKISESLAYDFPWRKVDSTHVKAVGFESKQFAFELDKPKILNLLTGHTLYSNSNVVVRELAQNALDATRLQTSQTKQPGEIALHLDTKERTLTVDDNGTGMNQRIIEEHFLNVGSSRYRDEGFRKQFPQFSAISRFGIGILSIFMISDEIEVITKSADETKARNISIRSINGQYLIRLVDPTDKNYPCLIKDHGTRIQLKLRAGVVLPKIREVAEHWILFPGCKITVQADTDVPIEIGSPSPKTALESALKRVGLTVGGEPGLYTKAYRVIEKQKDGLTVAIALEWQPTFKTWSFATADRIVMADRQQAQGETTTAICIHGIRVESSSPGFQGSSVLAISNVTGPSAPATNVARSRLEAGVHVDDMYRKIYAIYAEHVSSEIGELSSTRGQSISDAAREGRYLLAPLQASETSKQVLDADQFFKDAVKTIPLFTIDREEQRALVKISELEKMKGFWTVESSAYTSAENFVRNLPTGISIAKLALLSSAPMKMPNGDVVSGQSENLRVLDWLHEVFDIDEIAVQSAEKQVNFHWSTASAESFWKSVVPLREEAKQRFNQLYQAIMRSASSRGRFIVLQNSDLLKVSGLTGECGIKAAARTYLLRGNELHTYLRQQLDGVEAGTNDVATYLLVLTAVQWLLSEDNLASREGRSRVLDHFRQTVVQHSNAECFIPEEFRMLFETLTLSLFDPMRGERSMFPLLGNMPWEMQWMR